MQRRFTTAYEFLSSTLRDPEPDPVIEAGRQRIDPLKKKLDEADHYGIDADKVGGAKKSP
jgi:hypothetical protein